VKGPDGKPVEKARVTASPTGSMPLRMLQTPPSTRTDAAGAFRLQLKAAGLITVTVEAAGLAPKVLERVTPGSPLVITLAKGAAIDGIVKDGTTGKPAAGVRVEARRGDIRPTALLDPEAMVSAATTDAKGAFHIEGLANQVHTVSAVARGYGRAHTSASPSGRRVELFLFPGSSIRGVVRDAAGKPIPGVAVRAEGAMRFRRLQAPQTSDASGRYELLGLEPGVYRVLAHHKDYALGVAPGVVVERQADVDLDLRLEPGVTVTGRLVNEDSRPVAGHIAPQEISGEGGLWTLGDILSTDAGADGKFKLEHVPSGEHALAATARGFGPKRIDVSAGARPVDVGDVVLEPGGTIRGRVRDKAGNPIGGAQLTAFARLRGGLPAEAASEPDGTFVLAGLQGGSFQVTARASGYGEARATAALGAENLDVVMEPAGAITGLVVDDAGRVVESFEATADSARRQMGPMMVRLGGGAGGGGTSGSPDGRFTIYDLAPGDYVVEVTAPERGRAVASSVKVTAGATTDVGRLTLKAGGIVRGQVVDSAGAGIPGATVAVSQPGIFSFADRATATSDGSGAFEVRDVAPGVVSATATHPSYAAAQVGGLEVDTGKPAEARIVLSQGGRIEGTARRRGSQPIAGATVQVRPAGRGRMGMMLADATNAVTAPDGSYWVDHVPAGTAQVVLMAREGASTLTSAQTQQVEVAEGQTATADFLARDILLSGRLTRGGSPLPGVRLSLNSRRGMTMVFGMGGEAGAPTAGPQRMTAVSREDGGYEMLVDEPGDFMMRLEATDGRSLPGRTVNVPDVEAFAYDVDLPGITVAGIVVDKDTEQPIANATVSANPKAGGPPGAATVQTTGPDGRFQLDVDAGDYRLHARADGYGSTDQSVAVGAGGASDVRLALARGVSLRGRVLDLRDRPAASVDVTASPVDGANRGWGAGMTQADGTFLLDGLDPRPYVLFAGRPAIGGGVGMAGPVTPGDREVVVRLRPPARLRVTVRGPDGAPVKDVAPRVRTVNGVRYAAMAPPTSTDANGVVEMLVIAGTLTIEADGPGLRGEETVSVGEGGAAAVELTLAPPAPARSE
jgi:hypothetical protein